jgi:hypothetical protein
MAPSVQLPGLWPVHLVSGVSQVLSVWRHLVTRLPVVAAHLVWLAMDCFVKLHAALPVMDTKNAQNNFVAKAMNMNLSMRKELLILKKVLN